MRDEEPGEPMEKTSRAERTVLLLVALFLFLAFVAAAIIPHTPFAGD